MSCFPRSPSARRRRQSVLAVCWVLQYGRRLSGSHLTPPQVPWPLPPLLGQREPCEPGNVLWACVGAPCLQESAGPRQQHPDLRRPPCGVPRGQEECTRYFWHHSAGRCLRWSDVPRFSLHEKSSDSLQMRDVVCLGGCRTELGTGRVKHWVM